jgi:RNA polymerase sigma factor (sigma-70 family)
MGDTTEALTGLLGRLRAGDPAARRQVVERAYDRFLALARRERAKFPAAADESVDVLHDALPALDRAIAELAPETPARLFALAALHVRRRLLDAARRRAAHAPAGDSRPDSAAGPATVAAQAAEVERLTAVLDELTADHREVIDLTFYLGLTRQEAAEVLGVSDRTVKSRLRDAKLALAARLGGAGGCDDHRR